MFQLFSNTTVVVRCCRNKYIRIDPVNKSLCSRPDHTESHAPRPSHMLKVSHLLLVKVFELDHLLTLTLNMWVHLKFGTHEIFRHFMNYSFLTFYVELKAVHNLRHHHHLLHHRRRLLYLKQERQH